MNKRIWMVVILATALSACSLPRQLAAPEKCQPGKKITINHGARGIIVAPPNLCMEPGQSVAVNIVPNNLPLNAVSTRAKPDNPDNPRQDNWMNGSNSESTGRFTLVIPANVPACPKDAVDDTCEYEYSIEIEGFVILDPMITIRR